MSLPRMRTIPSAIKYFKTKDPETAVNEWWLRKQIKQGLVPSIKAGKRFLVDLDVLERYLSGSNLNIIPEDTNKICKIKI